MNKIDNITAHFRSVDLTLYNILRTMEVTELPKPQTSDYFFEKLCREIISQQLASKAAHAIVERFFNLFPHGHVHPKDVLVFTEQNLRDVGMSWAKARYIRDLAQHVAAGTLALATLHLLEDEAVIQELMKVEGIGRWTAEMFLIFTLGREDVFSYGDLGLRRAIQVLYKFTDKPTEKEMKKIVTKWSPYRSYASLALWHSLDNE